MGRRVGEALLAATLAVIAVMAAAGEGEAQGSERREATVMSYNIHHGVGADGRLDLPNG